MNDSKSKALSNTKKGKNMNEMMTKPHLKSEKSFMKSVRRASERPKAYESYKAK